jgi:hypothetical protein
MRLFSAIVLAGSFVAMPAGHAADKAAQPTEVHGVKLSSICNTCGVVSDVRKETVDRKGSSNGATDERASASGAVAGNESDKNAKTANLWTTTVTLKGGTTQTYQQSRNPGLHPGDVVTLQGGVPRKYVK